MLYRIISYFVYTILYYMVLRYIVLYHIISYYIIEGSLEVKLPTIWTDGKNRGGKSQGGEEKK